VIAIIYASRSTSTVELRENMNRYRQHGLLVIALLLLGSLVTASAQAATLQKVDQSIWGIRGLPAYVNMYIYVPNTLADNPPILVANHHCGGTGIGTYNETRSTLGVLADKNGFIMIFPEATGHNCWDVGSAKSLKHDAYGDTHAIAQMVRYTLLKYKADAGRVYAFGGSSGAVMTQALMAVYPDIFMAGVAVSGVPAGCWAQGYSGDVAKNGQWSGPCAGGMVTKTPEQWGDLVRSMYPGYVGHRPRLQLWHGVPDPIIHANNLGESIKEWTNVLSLSTAPTMRSTQRPKTTHQAWKRTSSACGYTALETFAVTGAGHAVQWDVPTVAGFLGLQTAVDQDPETAACPCAVPGASDAGLARDGGATSCRAVAAHELPDPGGRTNIAAPAATFEKR
jgi:poly(hydroxyalkanoate) depolymerase family esterase